MRQPTLIASLRWLRRPAARCVSARHVANPAIVLMDEPQSSVDDELNLHLRREILKLHTALGFTLIYVTHNREEAIHIGTRVIAMRESKNDGPRKSIYAS